MAVETFNPFPLPQAYSSVDFSPLARLGQYQQDQQRLADLARSLDSPQSAGSLPAGAPTGTAPSVGGTSAPSSSYANYMHGQYGAPGQNITPVQLDSGRIVMVNAAAAPSFRGFLNELEGSGYKLSDIGGYNYRNIRGSNRLSQHAYGNAIDINPAANPMGGTTSDLPPNISDLAAKYGLSWGGNWKGRKDPMHFEWMGPR